jgi:hypothetical protein
MASYPVTFDVARPATFDKTQVFVRILGYIIYGILSIIWYIPLLIAIWVAQKGGEKYLAEDGPKVKGWLHWFIGLAAYVYVLTDKFPSSAEESGVTFDVQFSGKPTLGSALLRIIFSIPSLIVLSVLAWVGAVIWLIASIMILIQGTYPEGLYDFNRGVVRWEARLLGYHASLVDPYPPFAFDTGPEGAAPAASTPAA